MTEQQANQLITLATAMLGHLEDMATKLSELHQVTMDAIEVEELERMTPVSRA